MTVQEISDVKRTWAIIAQLNAETVGQLFYNRLFEVAPQVRDMFKSPISEQSKKLLAMIGYVINKLDKLDDIIHEVNKLAERHAAYGAEPAHYEVVGSVLLWTLEKGLGEYWTVDVKKAWTNCYGILSGAMITATEKIATP